MAESVCHIGAVFVYCSNSSSVLILNCVCSSCDTLHARDVMRFLMSSHYPRCRWHHMEVNFFIVHYDQVFNMYTLFLGFL